MLLGTEIKGKIFTCVHANFGRKDFVLGFLFGVKKSSNKLSKAQK